MFYQNLAKVYSEVFPAQTKAQFIDAQIKPHADVLDIGCADGSMAMALIKQGHSVDGFDLSADMVNAARQKAIIEPRLNVKQGDMLNAAQIYAPRHYDAAICVGNTLVHLADLEQIKQAITQFKQALKPNGKLIIQILNYRAVYEQNIIELPLIENERVRFVRNYQLAPSSVTFKTQLTIKTTDNTYDAQTTLLPLMPKQLKTILHDVGFKKVILYSGYDGAVYDCKKLPLIAVAVD